jgi:hypothetical protein
MRVSCVSCGERFDRAHDEKWKVRCYACWVRSKGGEGQASCIHCGERFPAREVQPGYQARCRPCDLDYHLRIARATYARPAPLPASRVEVELGEHLRALLQLAHPDKHGGSAIATEATQWLLKVRKELRA